MRALVVYESMFGNTESLARTIGHVLSSDMVVEVHEVGDAPDAIQEAVDLIVVGAPTHAFSLSRPRTRADAANQGATGARTGRGVREWLEDLPTGPHSECVATFDTRVDSVRHLPGSAAKKADRIARDHGYDRAIARESFYVADVAGPLLPGERERACRWARSLAQQVIDRSHGRVPHG